MTIGGWRLLCGGWGLGVRLLGLSLFLVDRSKKRASGSSRRPRRRTSLRFGVWWIGFAVRVWVGGQPRSCLGGPSMGAGGRGGGGSGAGWGRGGWGRGRKEPLCPVRNLYAVWVACSSTEKLPGYPPPTRPPPPYPPPPPPPPAFWGVRRGRGRFSPPETHPTRRQGRRIMD